MNVRAFHRVDKATFWRFVTSPKRSDGERYEYVRGRIVQQMAGGTLKHSQIATRFIVALTRQLDDSAWSVNGSDRAVEMEASIRYPDVSVEAVGASPASLATAAPVLIVEVLSLSSQDRDLDERPVESPGLASLECYIVASQTEPVCLAWVRGPDGKFPAEPVEYDTNGVITVPKLGIALAVAEIYRGMEFSPQDKAPNG